MMHIDIISCQPKLLNSPLNHSIIKRAQEKNIVNIKIKNIELTRTKHVCASPDNYLWQKLIIS